MSTVDFKAVGDHASTLRQHATDSELSQHVKTLTDIAAAGKPKYGEDDDLLELCKLRSVAYRLQVEASKLDTLALKILTMTGEHPDLDYDEFVAGAAATDDEPTASGGMPMKDAYKHAAKDSPTAAHDSKVAQWRADWVASLPRYSGNAGGRQAEILPRAPETWFSRMLGRFK